MSAADAQDDADDSRARVAVIIVAYNSGAHLQRALDSLERQTIAEVEIVLWDNNSEDGAAAAARLPDNARLISSPDNLGFAGGNNRAIARTTAPFLALLNPDAVAEPDWLERLLAAAERHPDAGMVASLQRQADAPDRLDGAGDVYHAAGMPYRGAFGWPEPAAMEEGEVFGPCGAAALYRREAFEDAGGFDERFFCYCEDVDLAFRMRLLGWRGVFAPDAVVAHVGSASTGRWSAFAMYHGARNRLWTVLKNAPAALLAPMMLCHVVVVSIVTAAHALRRTGAAGPTVKGLWDGVRGLGPVLADRRALQRRRRAGFGAIARAMTWSPLKLARRAPDIRPFR